MGDRIERPCPVCAGTGSTPFWRKSNLNAVRCCACSMVYATPVDAELASGRFYDRLGTSFYLAPAKLESDYAPVRFERELRLFRAHCPQGAVLDVGCSTGAFLDRLRPSGAYTVTGTDVVGDALDFAASRGIETIRTPFLDHDFGPRRFAAVTFWAVIEHLVRPRAYLEKAVGLLEPDGCCIVLVPNLRSLAVRVCGVRYRYVMADHVNYFDRRTLAALAAGLTGARPTAIGTSHFNPVVIWQDWRGGLGRVSDTDRAQLLERTTRWKQDPRLGPIRTLYRLTEAVLARCGLADNLWMVLRR
jgi:2-polyprenyl-3-methyl-5-hydroxy-6-metoxy-1,4-benzoquinol methylase